MKIGILDYGAGNIQSVVNMFLYLGEEIKIISSKEELLKIEKLILPGVGNFDHLINELKKRELFNAVQTFALQNNFLLGICAGMQILFESSEEGKEEGLSILEGHINKLRPKNNLLPVPNMGWNMVKVSKQNPLLDMDKKDLRFYFAHSYGIHDCKNDIDIGYIEYDRKIICAVQKNNIFGFQFHPEKSHKYGLQLFQNFIKLR